MTAAGITSYIAHALVKQSHSEVADFWYRVIVFLVFPLAALLMFFIRTWIEYRKEKEKKEEKN